MTFKTIAEQEREAYITGHTQMAKMLGHALDGGVNQTEHEDQLEALQEDLDTAHSEIEDLQSDNDALKEDITQLRAELAEADKLNTWLRDELRIAEGG